MNQNDLLPIQGLPASPYTRKLLGLLRFRRIPYRYLQGPAPGLPEPRVRLLPVLYFRNTDGDYEAEVDSTPLIRRLEAEYPGRSVIPADPALAFINYLLEDYGDEWLTRAMFHYRWHHAADLRMSGAVLPHYADVTRSDEDMRAAGRLFTERQVSRLHVVGSNETTAPVIEASYRRFLVALNEHLKRQSFLLGARPASADFACFGQLTQLALFDPTPAAMTAGDFPRVHAWVGKLEDLSGLETTGDEGFIRPETAPDSLRSLLREAGRTYAPVMLANARALGQGLTTVETRVEDRPWVQRPFPYQAKCLAWLRAEHARLDAAERSEVAKLLDGTGCETLLVSG